MKKLFYLLFLSTALCAEISHLDLEQLLSATEYHVYLEKDKKNSVSRLLKNVQKICGKNTPANCLGCLELNEKGYSTAPLSQVAQALESARQALDARPTKSEKHALDIANLKEALERYQRDLVLGNLLVTEEDVKRAIETDAIDEIMSQVLNSEIPNEPKKRSTPDVENNGQLGQLNFQGYFGNILMSAAMIDAEVSGMPSEKGIPGRLIFHTTDSEGVRNERMRIMPDGKIGINTDAPNALLTIAGSESAGEDSVVHIGSSSTDLARIATTVPHGLQVDGNMYVGNNAHVVGNFSAGSISLNTLDIANNVTIGGTLGVTGATTLSSTLGVAGNTTVGGTFGVSGASTLSTLGVTNSATVGGTLGVTGATTLSSTLSAGASTLSSLGVTNNATVGGTLGVTGAATLSGTLSAGASTLNSLGVTNNATIGGTLGVTGTSTLGALSAGNSTLTSLGITNNATVGGTLGVTGAATLSSTLSAGASTLSSLNVTNNATVGGALGVTGTSTLGTLSAGTSSLGALTVSSDAAITLSVSHKIPEKTLVQIGDVSNPLSAGTVQLQVQGDVQAASFVTTSDMRIKTNVQSIDAEESLSIIRKLQPKTFDFSTEAQQLFNLNQGQNRGLMAQEVKEILPGLISIAPQEVKIAGNTINDLHMMNYVGIVPDLIGGVKALDRKVTVEARMLIDLLSHVKDLEERLKALENK